MVCATLGHVRRHLVLPVCEQRTGTPHAALDFVQYQQRTMVIAQFPYLLQEPRFDRHHATFALHRLDHHRGHITSGHRRFQLRLVVEIDITEAAGQRLIALLVLGLGRRGDRSQRAPVKAAAEGDDRPAIRRTALISRPFAYQLDRCLVGFGTGVAQKHLFGETRSADQFLGQSQRRLTVEDIAGMPQLASLFEQRRSQIRVTMPETAYRNACGQIDVLPTLVIPQARALAAFQHHLARAIHRQVVMGQG
jgi:hypothetical protein